MRSAEVMLGFNPRHVSVADDRCGTGGLHPDGLLDILGTRVYPGPPAHSGVEFTLGLGIPWTGACPGPAHYRMCLSELDVYMSRDLPGTPCSLQETTGVSREVSVVS